MSRHRSRPGRSRPRTRPYAMRTAGPRKKPGSARGPLLPALAFTIIITQLPFWPPWCFSFRNYNTNHPERYGWAGLANYRKVFKDPQLLKDIWHTIELTLTVVLVSLVLGPGHRTAAQPQVPGSRHRPHHDDRAVPDRPGGCGAVLQVRHLRRQHRIAQRHRHHRVTTGSHRMPRSSTGSPNIRWAVEIQLIWQWTPFMTLILLAGLQSRPGDVLEAAAVDGATGVADLHQ